MMRRAVIPCLILAALVVALPAGAGNLALDHNGVLYRLASDGEQLILKITTEPDSHPVVIPVPQTTRTLARNLNVDLDPATDTVVLAWQVLDDVTSSRVMLATYQNGTWFGPVVVAGDGDVPASNPTLLVHRVTATASDGTAVSDTFINMAWWEGSGADGTAVYAGIRLDGLGMPAMDELAPTPLSGLLPYGVSCSVDGDQQVLEHPKFFVDPETGDPHLLFADLKDCLFAFLQISSQVEGDDSEPDATSQRRRNVIVFGVREVMSLEPHLDLANAQVEVGHALSVVLYWDTDQGIRYVTMNRDGWSEARTLATDSSLSHEEAVQLIRSLTR